MTSSDSTHANLNTQHPSERNVLLSISFLLFLLLFGMSSYVHQNYLAGLSASRLDLLHTIVRKGRVEIDTWHENTVDKAMYDGHYYSDKAPSTVILALPSFFVGVKLLEFRGADLDSDSSWLFLSWFSTVFSVGIMTALGGVFAMHWLRSFVSTAIATTSSIIIFIGGLPFANASYLVSHGITVSMGFATFLLLKPLLLSSPSGSLSSKRLLGAGFCCGIVLAGEYTAGIILTSIFLWVLKSQKSRALYFCLGALPWVFTIPAYSWLCLGTPFELPYSYQASFPAMEEGLYAIKLPNAEIAWRLLFGPMRGWFFWSPFLLMAVPGFVYFQRNFPVLASVTYVLVMVQIIVISGRVWDWQAGWTIGPRYFSPILPWIAMPAVIAFSKHKRMGCFLGILSLLATGMASLVDGTPKYIYKNPLFERHFPALWQGECTFNLGSVIGIGDPWSLIPLLVYCGIIGYAISKKLHMEKTIRNLGLVE